MMKYISVLLLVVLSGLMPVSAQKNVLILENQATKKMFKYYEGDKIEVRTTDSLTVKGMISAVRDSAVVLDFYTELRLDKIREVQRNRMIVNVLSKVLMIGGVGLVAVVGISEAVAGTGNLNMNLLYAGAGGAAAGALLIPLQKSHHYIGPTQWKLKVVPVEKDFNYQKNKTITF